MRVSLGINPITWSNDDLPELGGDTKLETCLAETRAAGYAGTEMGGKFPKTAAALRPILDRHQLKFVSGWYSGQALHHSAEEEINDIASHLDLLAAMGSPVMVFAEGTNSFQGNRTMPASTHVALDDANWKPYGARLTKLAEHMATRGVRMAFHHHMGTAVQTEAEIDRLMSVTGEAVGLLLDTGHASYAGADPLALALRHVKRIVHVHCKDVRRDVLARVQTDGKSFLDAVLAGVFTVPGDGGLDFPPILRALREAGYAGWLVVEAEQDPAKAHPLTYAKLGFANLKRMAEAAGFAVDG